MRRAFPYLVAALTFLPLLSAALVVWTHGASPPMDDFRAYWAAGENVLTGQVLYGPVPDPPVSTVYRYAPWFAWVWAPVSQLPEGFVRISWYGLLLAASVSVLVPMIRYGAAGWAAAGVFSVFFVDGAATGNVSPLMAAALVHALPGRLGPLAIAACASLKGVPIALVIVYLGRRDWRSAAATIGLTVVLTAPTLLYDLSNAAFAPLPTPYGLGTVPPFWIASAAIAAALTWRFAAGRYGWLMGSAASLLWSPHLFVHSFALLAPGIAGRREHIPGVRRAQQLVTAVDGSTVDQAVERG